jgi:hypothetical protein
MTERERKQPLEPATDSDNDEITPAEADDAGEVEHRARRKAAGSLLSPAITPAAAGAMLDADPRLDDRSETEAALERAKGTPD